MIRSIRIISTLVLVSCVLSCKKDSDPKNDPNQIRLSKLIQYATADPAKEIITNEFIYDDQGRVVELTTSSKDSTGSEWGNPKIRSLHFFYNGNEKNPSRTIGAMPYASNPTVEIYHTYNSNGDLVQDSTPFVPVTYFFARTVRNYIYNGTKILVQTEDKDIYGNYVNSRDSFTVDNNNLTQIYRYTGPDGFMLKYDNKINPISKLNIASLVAVSGLNGIPSYLSPGASKNNITEWSYGNYFSGNLFTAKNSNTYTYSYNANNLPDECRYVSSNANYIVKYIYIE